MPPRLRASEAGILREAKYFLELLTRQKKILYRRVSNGPVIRHGPNPNKVFFTKSPMAGWPDLQVHVWNGPTLLIELKTTTGRLKPSQALVQEEIERFGSESLRYHIVRSLKELMDLLGTYGVTL